MSKKEKKSKTEAKSKKDDSDSESSSSYDSSSGSSSSDSEEERTQVKKPKLNAASKKRQKKEQRKQEKKKKLKAANKISKDDFYIKSIEFRLWLMEEKKLSMDSMKTTKAKALFKKFVKKWNEQKLAKKYYKGIDAADAKSSLTKYKWKFTERLHSSKVDDPSSTSNSPFVAGGKPTPQTTFSTFGKSSSQKKSTIGPENATIGPERPVIGPQRPPHLLAQQDPEDDREAERTRVKEERKKHREYHKLVVDELTPKATGHQAKIEKKLLRKQKASSPVIPDRVLMGSGMDYETMMAKKRKSDAARRERNTENAKVKLKNYEEKESAKMKALLEIARANKSKDALW